MPANWLLRNGVRLSTKTVDKVVDDSRPDRDFAEE
jgi:hypothetical protein